MRFSSSRVLLGWIKVFRIREAKEHWGLGLVLSIRDAKTSEETHFQGWASIDQDWIFQMLDAKWWPWQPRSLTLSKSLSLWPVAWVVQVVTWSRVYLSWWKICLLLSSHIMGQCHENGPFRVHILRRCVCVFCVCCVCVLAHILKHVCV